MKFIPFFLLAGILFFSLPSASKATQEQVAEFRSLLTHFRVFENGNLPFETHIASIRAVEAMGHSLADVLKIYQTEVDFYESLGDTGYHQRPPVFEQCMDYLRSRLDPPSETQIPETQDPN